jgi:hypothetical protein
MLSEALRFRGIESQPKGNSEAFLPETARQPLHLNVMALTCRELIAMLGEHRDQTLDSANRASADAHLLTCADCTTYLKSYEQTIRLSKVAFGRAVDSAAGDFPEAAIQEILRLGARMRNCSPR